MKRLLYTCLAALAAAYVAPAEDEPVSAPSAEETPAAEAAEDTQPDAIAAVRKKMELIDQAYASLEKPRKATTQNYNRHVEEVKERLKKMEDIKTQLDELEIKKAATGGSDYIFEVVPEEDRYKYETEGNALAKKAIDNLSSKSETAQIEGMRFFEMLRDTYQGLPQFKEANLLYQKNVNKFEKKWNTQLEGIKRERQKWPSSRREQTTEGEQRQYDALANKLARDSRNIEDEWFVPKMGNAIMLDKALSRARRAKSIQQSKTVEEGGKVPELLHSFWGSMDEVRELMKEGKLEEALDKVGEDTSYRELMSMSRYLLPDYVKEGIRKQSDELRSEIRSRQNERRNVERELSRTITAFDREVHYLETRMDRMLESLLNDKEDEVRRAEEAAAREAELKEQQEREAAEEAEAAEDDDEAEKPEVKKPKKKKSKKKDQ